jgi:hypothetical protein
MENPWQASNRQRRLHLFLLGTCKTESLNERLADHLLNVEADEESDLPTPPEVSKMPDAGDHPAGCHRLERTVPAKHPAGSESIANPLMSKFCAFATVVANSQMMMPYLRRAVVLQLR